MLTQPKLIPLRAFPDERGFFVEQYSLESLAKMGLQQSFVQDNHSHSIPGVIRGLHAQVNPVQGKLVSVIRGRIWDVAVDARVQSPTFGKWQAVELSSDHPALFWIPPGFLHGFCVLGDEPADVLYKVDGAYSPQTEFGIRWNDPTLKIEWPLQLPIVSKKDQALPLWADYCSNPKF